MFPAVGPQHAGVYKSVIANKLGKAACYAHLYVTGEAGTLLPATSTAQPLACPGCWLSKGPPYQDPSPQFSGEPSSLTPAPVAVPPAPHPEAC